MFPSNMAIRRQVQFQVQQESRQTCAGLSSRSLPMAIEDEPESAYIPTGGEVAGYPSKEAAQLHGKCATIRTQRICTETTSFNREHAYISAASIGSWSFGTTTVPITERPTRPAAACASRREFIRPRTPHPIKWCPSTYCAGANRVGRE